MTLPRGGALVALVSVTCMVVFAIALGVTMAMKSAAEWQIEQNDKERVVKYVPESPLPQTGADRWTQFFGQ